MLAFAPKRKFGKYTRGYLPNLLLPDFNKLGYKFNRLHDTNPMWLAKYTLRYKLENKKKVRNKTLMKKKIIPKFKQWYLKIRQYYFIHIFFLI